MKILKSAGVALILQTVLTIIGFIVGLGIVISNLSELTNQGVFNKIIAEAMPFSYVLVSGIISLVLIAFVYKGFIKLGKITKNNFLVVTSWIIMCWLIINLFISFFFSYNIIYSGTQNSSFDISNTIYNIIFLIFAITFYIIFGVSLLRIQDKVEMARTTGILYIISGATMIIVVGSVLLLVTQIFAAFMLFKASRKFER